jgi:hypothetical protein
MYEEKVLFSPILLSAIHIYGMCCHYSFMGRMDDDIQ